MLSSLMKHLLSILIFLSFVSVANAGVGDVYYCQSNQFVQIGSGKTQNFSNIQFTIKLRKNEIVWGEGEFNGGEVWDLVESTRDLFVASDTNLFGYFYYFKGKFAYSSYLMLYDETLVIHGKCDTFD